MNYRFGFSLGKTALDGQIYGLASAAADCFKALVPFFFFAALRNKMWSQALAAALVWIVVVAYSMTSALGHAALNRLDTTGQRALEAAAYKDLRADTKRAQEQLAWIPAHRPAETVAAEMDVLKAQRAWTLTKGCSEILGKTTREFCQQYHKLHAELGSAQQAQKLEARIAEIGSKLGKATGGTAMAEADPQASVLAKLAGVDVETVQTALTVFVALLIEIGSGFGMYVAFAYWRINDEVVVKRAEPAAAAATAAVVATPAVRTVREAVALAEPGPAEVPLAAEPPAVVLEAEPADTEEEAHAAPAPAIRRQGANDNRIANGVPDSDVQRFYRERIVAAPESSSVTSSELYEEYCAWCETYEKVPFAHPRVTREIAELGVKKERIGKRTRYFGIALRSAHEREEDRKLPAALPRAA